MEFIHLGNGMKLYFSSNDFKDNFDNDFKEFREIFNDADIQDYVKQNISLYNACIDNVTYITFDDGGVFIRADYLGENIVPEIRPLIKTPENGIDEIRRKQLLYTFTSILKFLKSKLISDRKIADTKPEPLLDFSNAKGTEKIVMLQQLGIIDFLKQQQPFIQSTNKLAGVISGITGEKAITIQSYINPMNDERTSQKNNPMTKKKVVSKVNQQLISIGYILPK